MNRATLGATTDVEEANQMGKRVLVVDDDAALNRVLVDALTDSGFEVVTARTGEDARAP